MKVPYKGEGDTYILNEYAEEHDDESKYFKGCFYAGAQLGADACWVPGKEAGKLLKQKGYTFDDTGFDYGSSTLAISIREILKL